MNKLLVGDSVIYVDHKGISHPALITAVWGSEDFNPEIDVTCINIIYVDTNPDKTDEWGRQVSRESSAPYSRTQTAHGNYWKFAE